MAKAIMIQGTSSGVGKSIITTGLCRIFHQDGYSVAPFKAQNMSNNAHRLESGQEIARSQAIQAYACEKEPSLCMNPVLLKFSKQGMEAVVGGKTIGPMDNQEYTSLKPSLWDGILDAYQSLSMSNDIVVLEGAGSPVEMNFKESDIANMGTAVKIRCPVILVADIERGGMFASVYGTLQLLPPNERELVKGIIVNKCIGKNAQFIEVKDSLEKITGLPVVGMVPHTAIDIEDEDGLIDPKTGPKAAKNLTGEEFTQYISKQFDCLADVLRKSLDINMIYDIVREGA